MSGTISGQVEVQGSIRTQGEQFLRSKSVASTPAWPLKELLSLGPSLIFVPFLTSSNMSNDVEA